MARLPSAIDLGSRPAPQPGGSVASFRPNNAGLAEGQALAQFGQDMVVTADRLHQVEQVEKKKADTLRAEDAFNQLRTKQLELTYEKDGFANKKGADAVKAPLFQDYNKRLRDHIDLIASGLGNPEQRALFLDRANVSSLQFGETILRHVSSEREAYAKETYAGTVATEERAAGAQWNDRPATQTSILRVTAAANTRADDLGIPKEGPESAARTAMVESAQSKVHSAVLGQMLANGKYEQAEGYFKENKDYINPEVAAKVQKAVEDAGQKQRTNFYRGAFIDGRNDLKSLQVLEKSINQDAGLDDTRRTALLSQVSSRMDVLQRRQEADYDRAIRRNEKIIGDTQTLILKGYEQTPDQLLPLLTATKGTELEPQVRNLIQLNQATSRFRLATPTEQESMRNQVAANVRQNPTAEGVRILNAFDSIAENQRKEVKDNPVGFAYRQGLADPQQINMQNPAQEADKLLQQIGVARGVAARYSAPFKPLQPDQVAQATAFLATAKPDKQLEYFNGLRTATAGDSQAYNAILGQIAPDNPALALAGDYAARGRSKAATDILTGLQILKPNRKEDGSPTGGKIWPLPTGKEEQNMRTIFSDQTSGALSVPEHRNAIEQSARAIYAARTVDANDDSGLLNGDRWKQAIKDATGGIASYKGRKTLMPYGIDSQEFQSGVYERINAMSGNLPQGITVDKLRGQQLEAVGDGRYVFRVGDSVLVGKDGKPLMINFNVAPAQTGLNEPPSPEELDAAGKPYTGRARGKDKGASIAQPFQVADIKGVTGGPKPAPAPIGDQRGTTGGARG